MATSKVRITVVIVSDTGRYNYTSHCLDSLLGQSSKTAFEVLLVLSGKNNIGLDNWISKGLNARLIRVGENNYCMKRNRGAAAAIGDIVAYIDDDAKAMPGWVDSITEEFSDEWKVAGGRVEPVFEVKIPGELVGYERWIGGFNWLPLINYSSSTIIGCNMFFDRKWLLQQGGFDVFIGEMNMTSPRLFFGGDETDIIARLAPREIGFISGAKVLHSIQAVRINVESILKRAEGIGRARRYIDRKNGIKNLNLLNKYLFFALSLLSVKKKLIYKIKYKHSRGYLSSIQKA